MLVTSVLQVCVLEEGGGAGADMSVYFCRERGGIRLAEVKELFL